MMMMVIMINFMLSLKSTLNTSARELVCQLADRQVDLRVASAFCTHPTAGHHRQLIYKPPEFILNANNARAAQTPVSFGNNSSGSNKIN
jgi:hypothetical protein